MRIQFFTLVLSITAFVNAGAQVTKINSNKSLEVQMRLDAGRGIYRAYDSTLWVTDATNAGTFQLSNTIKYLEGGNVLNGKFIFPGTTAATGTELYITDGTIAGTTLLKDIYPGITSSDPDDDFAPLNGFLYFSANTQAEGRELWRTNGTPGGTTLVKDIFPGPGQSSMRGKLNIYSNGSYLLLTPATTEAGYELWKSDGTAGGTNLLKDIYTGPLASDITGFAPFGNLTLFMAKDILHGPELWKTDGTAAGTQMVKDINPGPLASMNYFYLLTWNNKGYFVANNGTTGEELWSTDGTTDNTFLVKDIEPGLFGGFSLGSLASAVKYPNKFIFTAYQQGLDYELWESDGTTNGTRLFKEIGEGLESGIPYIMPPYDVTTPGAQQLFQGNKFFFLSIMPSTGSSLWISDGTANGTVKIKSIDENETDGLDHFSYIYTPKGLYLAADDGVHGNELWKSNGTAGGTGMIADINPNAGSSDVMFTPFLVNNKLLFEGNDGDHAEYRDLFRLDEDQVLPVKLSEFTAVLKANDGLLQWTTAQELNSRDFIIERSYNGLEFDAISTVPAAGYSMNKTEYQYTDRTINFKNTTVYYRLQMNDKDGKQITSKVIALPLDGSNKWDLSVIPAASSIQVKVKGGTYPVQLQVFDMSGRIVANSKISSGNTMATISLSSFAPGVYMIQAINNNERKTVQFVKP